MKKIITILVMLAAVIGCFGQNAATLTGTTYATNLAYAVFPAMPDGGQYEVTYVNVTSDNATGAVYIATIGAPVAITTAQSAATNILTLPVSLFTADKHVLYRDLSANTYKLHYCTNVGASTISLAANLAAAAEVGDLVYPVSNINGGKVVAGNATKELSAVGGGVFFGEAGKPALISVTGASSCSVNAVSARPRKD